MNARVVPPRIQRLYCYWVGHSRGERNAIYLARMLAAHAAGHSVLSGRLGLDEHSFACLLRQYFPEAAMPGRAGQPAPAAEFPEREDLVQLLLNYRAGRSESETWLAGIVAAGCGGSEHLWYDLGLWSRQDLQALMAFNFPGLVRRNLMDMKWKKFLYRQLCEATGHTLCRSPSCVACSEYDECFGPE